MTKAAFLAETSSVNLEPPMTFRITGLDPAPFRPLYGLSDAELHAKGVRRCHADATPGYPDRVELRDAANGEPMLLLNHTHQPADTPFRASHAIYVREGAERAYDACGEIPDVLQVRLISLRAFDAAHMMTTADAIAGEALAGLIEKMLADPNVAYLHAHYAKPGCFAALIRRK